MFTSHMQVISWLLYKTERDKNVFSSNKPLQAAQNLGAGKTTVALLQDLDLTPLSSDATEFQEMPKAACQVCKECLCIF